MSSIQSIIDRLLEPGTPYRSVEGAVDFASIDKHHTAAPAAYVFAKEEAADDNGLATGGVRQRLETDVAVVIAASNVSDPRLGAAASDLEALKTYNRSKLLGFVPDGADDLLIYVSGELIAARRGTAFFEEIYGLATYLEAD